MFWNLLVSTDFNPLVEKSFDFECNIIFLDTNTGWQSFQIQEGDEEDVEQFHIL